MREVRVGLAAIALLMSAACSAVGPSPSTPADLEISNGTTLVVTLAVNGSAIAHVNPGGLEKISPSRLPSLPWIVEARAASGRVLVYLSCGRLDVWSGPPLAGPVPGLGHPGDCDP